MTQCQPSTLCGAVAFPEGVSRALVRHEVGKFHWALFVGGFEQNKPFEKGVNDQGWT